VRDQILSVGLAILIPYIDLFISLVGALCISALGLAFPAIFDSSTRWHQLSGWHKYWVHFKNFLIVLFSLFGLAVGTATSMEQIIEKFTLGTNATTT